jgi:hypothetical protein
MSAQRADQGAQMRIPSCTLLFFTLIAVPAAAQTKISGRENCGKSNPRYSIDVGDHSGRGFMIQKSICSWEKPIEIEGTKSKVSVDVSASQMRGMKWKDNGYSTTTMENGDKFTVHYLGDGHAAKDGHGVFAGKWKFVDGTGKLKGIKGGGTYKGSGAADGSGAVEVEGEYAIRPAGAAKSPSKK